MRHYQHGLYTLTTISLILFVGGCSPQLPRSLVAPLYLAHVPTSQMNCEQANQNAYQIVKDAMYSPTVVTPATPQRVGTIEGTRPVGALNSHVTVTITCNADEVTGHGWYTLGGRNQHFPHYFYERFLGMAEAVQRIAYVPPGQTRVTMKPLRGKDTIVEFGTEVANVLPVRLEITNATNRTYTCDTETVVLVTPEGKAVKPLSGNATSVPKPALSSQSLAPGASIKGYLYYPPGAYTSARGALVDQEQEQEGFEVRF